VTRPVAAGSWGVVILAALGVHAVAFLLLGVDPVRDTQHVPQERGTRWMGERTGENIDLIDPEPLFLPTRRNAGAKLSLNSETSDPGVFFRLFESNLSIPPGTSPAGLVTLPEGVRTAGVAIRRFSRPYFSAFGEVDERVEPLPGRAAMIAVTEAATGAPVLRREISLPAAASRGAEPSKWPLWEPFDMIVAVEPTGMLGIPLVPAPGSGVEAVDAFFRSHLRELVRPDLILPVGYYRVVVGP